MNERDHNKKHLKIIPVNIQVTNVIQAETVDP